MSRKRFVHGPLPLLNGMDRELADLSRLALHGSRRDLEMYVHRLAYRHRDTPLGEVLAAYDVMPPIALRGDTP